MGVETETGGAQGLPWQDSRPGLPDTMPEIVREWISLDTSMTQALARSFGTDVRVRVLADGTGSLLPDEAALLSVPELEGFVREVVLQGGGRALLAARTVHVSGPLRHRLASLGARPLGELLFAAGKPCLLRQQYALLSPATPLFALVRQADAQARAACWARRGLYLLEQQALLLTEVFLDPTLQRTPA